MAIQTRHYDPKRGTATIRAKLFAESIFLQNQDVTVEFPLAKKISVRSTR